MFEDFQAWIVGHHSCQCPSCLKGLTHPTLGLCGFPEPWTVMYLPHLQGPIDIDWHRLTTDHLVREPPCSSILNDGWGLGGLDVRLVRHSKFSCWRWCGQELGASKSGSTGPTKSWCCQFSSHLFGESVIKHHWKILKDTASFKALSIDMGIHILTKFHKGNLRGVGVGWSLRSRRSPGVRSLCAAWVLCGRFLPEENAGIWRVWQLSGLGTPHCHMGLVGSWTCKRSDSLSLYLLSLISSYLILSHLISSYLSWFSRAVCGPIR